MAKKKLGRGLESLLGLDDETGSAVALADCEPNESGTGQIRSIVIEEIEHNPFQPRVDIDPEELASLAQSITTHGVIQPVVVRPMADGYQLIAGERRLRAAQETGLTHIPALSLDADDQEMFELTLIENLQRTDLNPLEKARAFQSYIDRFGTTHETLATHLGVNRSTVTNLIRLLELPDSIQEAIHANKITAGHARALLSLDDPVAQITLCRNIQDEALSVRQTESLVREHRHSGSAGTNSKKTKTLSKTNHVLALENELRQRLGTKVVIQSKTKNQGTFIIHFGSNDDFERILEVLRS